ncbi:MFS transporter [Paenarthrobacter sp. NPDC090520]|uniref:MFS transporter n=1 Tax=unclassified Paenarthrobacter TaxID=2634190 RepID=UPI0037F42161
MKETISPETVSNQNPESRPSLSKLAVASCAGTAIEYYDFLAYAIAASTVFNAVFFPATDPAIGTLLSLATFATGFLARPLGGIIIGHFGDRLGRKRMLLLTLVCMGGGTVLIGVLPGYAQIGIWAPIILVLLRLIQGFAAGGEFAGAALIAIEHAPANKRGFYGSWTILGVSIGALLATGAFSLLGALPKDDFAAWGWRLPFLASIVIGAVGLLVRFGIDETPAFLKNQDASKPARLPLVEVIRKQPKAILLSTGALVGYSTFVYVVFTFLLSYGTQELALPRTLLLNASMLGLLLQVVTVPAWAALSDRIGRKPVMLLGGAFLVVFAFALFPLVRTGNTGVILAAVVVAYSGSAAIHAPMAAFFAELFGTGVRYSGISLGYQLGNVLGGGLAPVIATALFATSGKSTDPVAIYLAATAAVSILCLLALPNTGRKGSLDLEA